MSPCCPIKPRMSDNINENNVSSVCKVSSISSKNTVNSVIIEINENKIDSLNSV